MKRSVILIICVSILVLAGIGCDMGGSDGYEIGDTGPAGGHIFYIDKANVFDWTYLEAAPRVTEVWFKEWGPVGTAVGGDAALTGIGDGQAATDAIVAYMEDESITDTAAQYCASLSCNGYDDWFLPSRDELALMQSNLYQEGVGNFDWFYYWSSSESSFDQAYIMAFYGSGQSGVFDKDYEGYITRAVRAF